MGDVRITETEVSYEDAMAEIAEGERRMAEAKREEAAIETAKSWPRRTFDRVVNWFLRGRLGLWMMKHNITLG